MEKDILRFLILIVYNIQQTAQQQTGYQETPRKPDTVFPNWGYEPYWYNGHWILKTTFASTLEDSPLVTYKVCGDECSYMIQRLGKVCGRSQSDYYWDYRPCPRLWLHCYNQETISYNDAFKTYENYCALLSAQCTSGKGHRILFVHVGPCVYNQNEVIYKNINNAWRIADRKHKYVSDMEERFKNYSTVKQFDINQFTNLNLGLTP